MRNNPYAPTVPCHRVVASNLNIGGFQGATEGEKITKKISMLTTEGVKLSSFRVLSESVLNIRDLIALEELIQNGKATLPSVLVDA